MQTFLLFLIQLEKNQNVLEALLDSFNKTAKTLDYKRLGKQRVEAMQLLNVLLYRIKLDTEYKTHQEVKELLIKYDEINWPFKPTYKYTKKILEKGMLKHSPALKMWIGYVEELKLYFNCIVKEWKSRGYKNNLPLEIVDESSLRIPPFLQNEDFIKIQRQNLIRKDKNYYGEIWKDLEETEGYLWYHNGQFYRKKFPKK